MSNDDSPNATRPLVRITDKPWKKCSTLPDCAQKNPEIIHDLTGDLDAPDPKKTNKLEAFEVESLDPSVA